MAYMAVRGRFATVCPLPFNPPPVLKILDPPLVVVVNESLCLQETQPSVSDATLYVVSVVHLLSDNCLKAGLLQFFTYGFLNIC